MVVGTIRDRLPLIDAVGLPLLLFINANFALLVACPPINKSTVELLGNKAPLDWFQNKSDVSPNEQLANVGAEDP